MFGRLFDAQEEMNDDIREGLGLELDWNRTRARVGVSTPAAIADPAHDLSTVQLWMANTLAGFDETITPYLK